MDRPHIVLAFILGYILFNFPLLVVVETSYLVSRSFFSGYFVLTYLVGKRTDPAA